MYSVFILSLFVVGLYSQKHECIYTGGPDNAYTLNLTQFSDWTMEYQANNFFFYYTPCGNRLKCQQGNAFYSANVAQYKPGVNGCAYFLSVDHHDRPQYNPYGASWLFEFEDGEMCEQLNEPRRTNVWYNCDENVNEAYLYDVSETSLCHYNMIIRSRDACVPEDRRNAHCQWRFSRNSTDVRYLDLSELSGTIVHVDSSNMYTHYFSPCQNALHCYQQYPGTVMSIIENMQTRTCDHYLAIWDEGRVQPIYHEKTSEYDEHWSFHYWLSEKCSNGALGEETIRFFCDRTAKLTVLSEKYDYDCRWELNLATRYAC